MADKKTWSFASRDDVPERYKWDLDALFASDEAFEEALAQAQDLPQQYADWEQKACATGEGLLAYLRFDDEATVQVQRLWNYAGRRADEDTRESRYQDLNAQVGDLMARVSAGSSWFEPAILALSDDTLDTWYALTPDLDFYRLALDRVRARKAHTLDAGGEALLAKASVVSEQPGLVFTMLDNADLSFPDAVDSKGAPHAVTLGSFVPLETSGDRALRESAYHSLYGGFRTVQNTSAALLAAQMRQLKFFADARHYDSALAASLEPNEIPCEVYTSLISSVHRNLEPLHRYMALKKKALGLDEMRYWDMYVPTVVAPERSYSFEEARDMVLEAMAPLGDGYLSILRRAFDERWIDVFETPGKISGAYSADGHGMRPLVLLNYQGTLEDVFTLAHELGHAAQTWLSNENQPARYAEYSLFVAEVASTTNECLLLGSLLNKAGSPAERVFLLDHFCDQFRATLYRQTLFAEFELMASEACARGEGVGATAFSRQYRALNDAYYGPAITSDDEIALEWSRIPHFYYDFYDYMYATSFSAAVALSERIAREGTPAVDAYLQFLSAGCSKAPLDLLQDAGVDMASGAVVDDALARFGQLVDELAGALA